MIVEQKRHSGPVDGGDQPQCLIGVRRNAFVEQRAGARDDAVAGQFADVTQAAVSRIDRHPCERRLGIPREQASRREAGPTSEPASLFRSPPLQQENHVQQSHHERRLQNSRRPGHDFSGAKPFAAWNAGRSGSNCSPGSGLAHAGLRRFAARYAAGIGGERPAVPLPCGRNRCRTTSESN